MGNTGIVHVLYVTTFSLTFELVEKSFCLWIFWLFFFNFVFLFLSGENLIPHCSQTGMERKALAVFGIIILLTVAVLLTDGQKPRQNRPWYTRRFTRQRRPTKAMPGGSSRVQINPVRPAQNNPNEQQDFDNPEDAQEYWRIIYENGKCSQTWFPSLTLHKKPQSSSFLLIVWCTKSRSFFHRV